MLATEASDGDTPGTPTATHASIPEETVTQPSQTLERPTLEAAATESPVTERMEEEILVPEGGYDPNPPVRRDGLRPGVGDRASVFAQMEFEPRIARVQAPIALRMSGINFWYGKKQALHDVNLEIPEKQVTAFIGPSGCGKSTLLRLINRLSDLTEGARREGEITLEGESVFSPSVDVNVLRRRIGMVFQKSNPFPKSIFENAAYGLRIGGENRKEPLAAKVESCLRRVGLWDEVKDRLDESALDLSGGQQQRLCIARAVAVEPEVILMDEPCSALDPIATNKIEDLIEELVRDFTIVIVTHNLQQASRVSHYTAFLWLGRIAEFDTTENLFTRPALQLTEDYISGRFG